MWPSTHRNAAGWIDEIEGSEHRYRFAIDAAGRVTGYVVVDEPCAAPLPVARGRIDLGGIDGVDGNDSVTLSGRATLALAPAPIANGLRVIVCGPSGALVDVSLPAGAYDRATRTGWRGKANRWTFASASLIGGVFNRATVRTPPKGETIFRLSGRRATVTTHLPELPLSFAVLTDAGRTETWVRAEFPGPAPLPRCSVAGTKRVTCR